MKKILARESGQALVSLLLISLIGFTVITTAAILVYNNNQSTSTIERGDYAYYIAESGIEEALLRLLRDPAYSGTAVNQPISIGEGNVSIVVNNNLITATGIYGDSIRKVQVQTVYNNGIRTISSWKEIQ